MALEIARGAAIRPSIPRVFRSPGNVACLLGYALLSLWAGTPSPSFTIPSQTGALSVYSPAFHMSQVAVLIAVALLAPTRPPLRSHRSIFGVSLALVAVCPPLMTLMGFFQDGSLGTATGLLTGAVNGVAHALTFFLWVEAFSLLDMRSLCICFAGATGIGIVLRTAATLVAGPWMGCVLYAVAGMASILLCRTVDRPSDVPSTDSEAAETGPYLQGRFPWRPVLLTLVFYPAFSLILHGMGVGDRMAGVQELGSALVCAAVALHACFAYPRFTLRPLYGVVLPCMCAALLGAMGTVAGSPALVLFLAGVGIQGFALFIYLLLFSVASRYRVNALWLLGIISVPRALAKGLAGLAIGAAGVLPQSPAFNQLISGAIIALIVASLLFVSGNDFGSSWGIVREEDIEPNRPPTIEQQCHNLARLYSLTRREEDVLLLLAQNYDVAAIGKELVLSKGTVRSHVQHIYRKFAVHSKEELLQQLDVEPARI